LVARQTGSRLPGELRVVGWASRTVHPGRTMGKPERLFPLVHRSEVAGLVCAAHIAQANGDAVSARLYLITADSWQSQGDGGPSVIDQREVADAGFLELVRLGIKPAYDEVIINSLEVVDAQIATKTPNGTFWRRYNFDGYGETATGAPWGVTSPDTFTTHGRLWPIFAGEPR
jgi:glucoamylase